MLGYKRVEIKNVGRIFFYNEVLINKLKKNIVSFLADKPYMNDRSFARRMILSLEVKTNNAIEGECDDFQTIDSILKHHSRNSTTGKRIINLYQGYQYILEGHDIDKDNLHQLYEILSNGVLDEFSIANMGDYYRTRDVFILKSGSDMIGDFDKGLPADKISSIMDELFNYINSDNDLSPIDSFIKSQIIHYLFVYIHPYFDVNGRCSRTLSMWYLLNNGDYPYTIFNRGIPLTKEDYLKSIRKSRTGNLTPFLTYMLNTVHLELEKEYVIMHLVKSLKALLPEQLEILEYILTLDNPPLDRLYTLYILYNKYMNKSDFEKERINPLVKIGAINIDGLNNRRLSINKSVLRIPSEKIKQLKHIKL